MTAKGSLTVRLAVSRAGTWHIGAVTGDAARVANASLSETSGYDTVTLVGVHPGTTTIQIILASVTPGGGGAQRMIEVTVT